MVTRAVRHPTAGRRCWGHRFAPAVLTVLVSCGAEAGLAPTDTAPWSLAQSERITEAATVSLVARSGDDPNTLVEITEWAGPTDEVGAPDTGLDVAIVHCGTRYCEDLALFVAEAASDLGWKPTLHAPTSGGSMAVPIGNAVDAKPDVVVVAGLDRTDSTEATRLAAAGDAGAVVVSIAAASPPDPDDDTYDVVVADQGDLAGEVSAHAMIAATDARARVLVVPADSDAGRSALDAVGDVMSGCTTCVLTEGPRASGIDLRSAVEATLGSTTGVDYVVVAAEDGLVEASRLFEPGSGPGLVVVGGDETALDLVASGVSPFHARVSSNWLAYAAIDRVVRTMRGGADVPATGLGIGVRLFVPGTLPGVWGPEDAFIGVFDWALEYLRMWGLN